MKKIKIALYQCRLKGFIPKNILKILMKKKPDFLILPEYFFMNPLAKTPLDMGKDKDKNLEYLYSLSSLLPETVIIGGSMINFEKDRIYNTCFIFFDRRIVGQHHKKKLFGREIGKIDSGEKNEVLHLKGISFSVLICADVLHEENFENLKEVEPDIIFIPTFSPYKDEVIPEKIKRDHEIFVHRSRMLDSYIVKVCGVNTPGHPYTIQGRSLISSPAGILWRTPFHRENDEIFKISVLKINPK